MSSVRPSSGKSQSSSGSKSEHAGKSERSGKSEHDSSKPERSGKPERAEKPERAGKGEGAERSHEAQDAGKENAARSAERSAKARREQAASDQRAEDTEKSQQAQKEAQRRAVANTPQMKAYRGESSFEQSAKEKEPVALDPARRAKPTPAEAQKTQAEVESTLARTNEGRKALEAMKAHELQVDAVNGGGSRYENGKIKLDTSQGSAESSLELVHEVNHAVAEQTGQTPDPAKVSKQEYVDRMIREEAEGTAAAINAKRELAAQGVDVSNTKIELEQQYAEAHDRAVEQERLRNANATQEQLAEAGRAAGLARVEEGYRNGEAITATTGETYGDYYGKAWQSTRDAIADGRTPPAIAKPDGQDNPNPPALNPGRIGINDNFGTDPVAIGVGDVESMRRSLADDHALGATETRLTLNVDPQRGLLDPTGQREATVEDYKPFFDAARDAGMAVDVVFMPAGVDQNHNMADYERNGKAWAEKVGQVAGGLRSKYGVTSFEVGNEPNEGIEPKGDIVGHTPDGKPIHEFENGKYFQTVQATDRDNKDLYRDHDEYAAKAYMKYLDPTYDAIKANAGQDAKVAMAGISYVKQNDDRFLRDLYDAGLKENTDAINIHPYGLGHADQDDVRDNIMRIQAVMSDHEDNHKIWVTEMGTQTGGETDAQRKQSEKDQATYLRNLLQNLPDNVEKAHVFSKSDWDGTYGITYRGGEHKPSWNALHDAIAADNNAARTRKPAVAPELTDTYAHWSPMLGNAKGPETRNGNTVRQDFEHGYVERDESGNYNVYTVYGGTREGSVPKGNNNGGITYELQNGRYDYDNDGNITVTANDPNAAPTRMPDPFVEERADRGIQREQLLGAPYFEPFSMNIKQDLRGGGYLLSDPFGNITYQPPKQPPPPAQ